MKHDRIDKLRARNSPCSQAEWERILTSVLVQGAAVQDVEATATVREEGEVTIHIARRIENITVRALALLLCCSPAARVDRLCQQKLGVLELPYKADEEPDMFDWCVAALGRQAQIQDDLSSANAKVEGLESALDKLKGQLDEFITAKNDEETALLEKFRLLLNSKKHKIREQQQIINSMGENTAELGSPQAAQTRASAPRTSGAGKRKVEQAISEEDDSDDGFEKMDLDERRRTQAAEEERATTDDDGDDDDDATSSEAEGEEGGEPASGRQTRSQDATVAVKTSGQPAAVEGPPPRRNLPLAEGKEASNAPPKSAPPTTARSSGGSETESDDEL